MNFKRIIALVLAVIMIAGMFVSCAQAGTNGNSTTNSFDYGAGLTEEGFFDGVKALDYIQLPDYDEYEMPYELTVAKQEDIDRQIETIKANFTKNEKDTDISRVIVDGDTVNIDYVGTVDGEEFDGGNTNGAGTDVIIGVTNYIDGFLDQLIGHKAGDNFDITVTFPEDYDQETLRGKEAVFNITINHLYVEVVPEITDEFVAENLSAYYSNVEELMKGLEDDLINRQKKDWLLNKLLDESVVNEYPQRMRDYEINYSKSYLESTASRYSMTGEEFIQYVGYESVDAYIESLDEDINETVKYYLLVQGICEREDIRVEDEDISRYFKRYYGTDDYTSFENAYGKSYLKLIIANEKMMNVLLENMPVAEQRDRQ